ncbi:hypothetical protein BU25DRAFT_406136 [Macroventuria anomochaeta]|uniref:Uncharacterized protein n=1 Tax=Macroventuria anomochaeta TaxID=301207 RepID=A0ACB6SFK5_9PLEO|nr:uncharacterized protein BU25DRAFT_406136 [Macroventuria anomochaeta]KAF2632824.1 hypothetical protein BU25DRAFT_406136 [Macroventuria anomochaeta]
MRKFDGVRCCLACGEAVFEEQQIAPTAIRLKPTVIPVEYQHTRLHLGLGKEICLVVLLPGRDLEPLQCEIKHVYLDDKPVFEAVSYTWAGEDGDDSKSRTIQFTNGAIMHVTINCEAALLQLRHPSRERRLWIDAICINQTDVTERNRQVGLIDQIFSAPQSVVISIPYAKPSICTNVFCPCSPGSNGLTKTSTHFTNTNSIARSKHS